jgi:hypothetical protein
MKKKSSTEPKPLDIAQIKHVVELLELRQLAPKEAAARFERLGKNGTFSEAQQEAIEILFSLEEDEIGDALLDFADDEARDFVRDELVHEARLSFEPA